MDAAVFGRFLAETRRARNMTQAELAGRVGVTDKAVSRWERGVGFPDINTLEPLAAALLRRLDAMYRDLLSDDLIPWRKDYRAACVTLGREVRVLRPEGERRAFARDVDDAFGLTVDYPDGTGETLRSGEVSVRGLAAYAEGAAP